MKKRRNMLTASICLIAGFIIWTIAICCVDVQQIGVQGSDVGFATLNKLFHSVTKVNLRLYNLTDWLGLVPIGVCISFSALGAVQLFKKRSIRCVDRDLLVLGLFYGIIFIIYIIFEIFPINYRPILINGCAEASYPSSTTLLTMSVMPTAIHQIYKRAKNQTLKTILSLIIILFTGFMVLCRAICGVHWLTDIIGGILISSAVVTMYYFICDIVQNK